nr:MAG TPA: hypothetical protein [Caudoviricetes sp.]
MDNQEWSIKDIDPNNEILLHGGKWSEEAKRRVSEARRAGRSVFEMFGDVYKKTEKTVSSTAKSASNMVRPTAKAVSKTASNLIRVAKKGVFSQGSKTTTITRVKSITDAQGHKVGPKTAEAKRRKTNYERGKAMDKRYADEKRRKTDSARGKAMDERERRNRQEGMKTLKDNARSAKNLPEGRVNRSGIGHDFGKAVDQARQKGVLKPNKKAYDRAQFEKGKRGEYNDRQFKKGKRGEYNDRMNDFQKRKKGLVKRGSLAGSLRQSATFDYQAVLVLVQGNQNDL